MSFQCTKGVCVCFNCKPPAYTTLNVAYADTLLAALLRSGAAKKFYHMPEKGEFSDERPKEEDESLVEGGVMKFLGGGDGEGENGDINKAFEETHLPSTWRFSIEEKNEEDGEFLDMARMVEETIFMAIE